jgi:D-alanyl-D-alanine dipeptidase/carboxypeptidase
MPTIRLTDRLIHTGSLMLVNRAHSIIEQPDWAIMPVEEASNICMAQRPAAALTQLLKEINAQNQIVPVSGFRSKEEQAELMASIIRDKGTEFSLKYVAFPGCSEHQTGLAVDLAQQAPNIDFICPNFPSTGICGKLRAKAADYGFIERYAKGKERPRVLALPLCGLPPLGDNPGEGPGIGGIH